MGLSKTEFMRGMQCPKQLWLDTNKPELKIIPEQTQRRLDRGNEFGDKAMAMFGPFVEVTEYIPNTKYLDKRKMVQNTKNAMRTGENNICEASFDYHGLFCAVDIPTPQLSFNSDIAELAQFQRFVVGLGPAHGPVRGEQQQACVGWLMFFVFLGVRCRRPALSLCEGLVSVRTRAVGCGSSVTGPSFCRRKGSLPAQG